MHIQFMSIIMRSFSSYSGCAVQKLAPRVHAVYISGGTCVSDASEPCGLCFVWDSEMETHQWRQLQQTACDLYSHPAGACVYLYPDVSIDIILFYVSNLSFFSGSEEPNSLHGYCWNSLSFPVWWTCAGFTRRVCWWTGKLFWRGGSLLSGPEHGGTDG